MPDLPIGLQLWTVRDHAARDLRHTLERVAQLGLDGVEFAGFGNLDARGARQALDDFGLRAAGSHVAYTRLFDHLDEEVEHAREIGTDLLVCPWARFGTDGEWLSFADRLEEVAGQLRARGLRLAYHNHAHELSGHVGGERVLEALLARAPSVLAELDVAWLEAGGVSAAEYLRRYAGRTPLVHVKDFRSEGDGHRTVELGTGETDLDAALQAARAGGAEWLLLEQDECPGEPFDSVGRNLDWLKGRVPA